MWSLGRSVVGSGYQSTSSGCPTRDCGDVFACASPPRSPRLNILKETKEGRKCFI